MLDTLKQSVIFFSISMFVCNNLVLICINMILMLEDIFILKIISRHLKMFKFENIFILRLS
jgi:hypothetical protein